jgi:3-hydroxyisobutyrate dehydrogenase
MGAPIARNLLGAGFSVRVWNRTQAKAAMLVAEGAQLAFHPSEAAGGRRVCHHAGRPGCREKRHDWARLARLASGHQVPFVDAPVSGSTEPAERGELLWLERVGDGSRLKLAINNWLGVLVEGMAETISLSTALGLDPRLFLHAIAAGPLASEYAIAKGDAMLQADFVAGFPLQHAMKDAELASSAAHQRGVELPLTEAMLPRWQHAIALGHGGDDIASAVAAAGKIADAS